MSQNTPRQTQAANRLIEQLMRALLGQSPGATRVRLALLHNQDATAAMAWVPRYDVTHSVAVSGRTVGRTPLNQPLTDWDAFLPELLAGRCSLERLSRIGVAALRSRVASARLTTTLVCPADSAAGQMAGALFILWDGTDGPPADEGLRRLMGAAERVAALIVGVLDLCGHRPCPIHITTPDFCLEPV